MSRRNSHFWAFAFWVIGLAGSALAETPVIHCPPGTGPTIMLDACVPVSPGPFRQGPGTIFPVEKASTKPGAPRDYSFSKDPLSRVFPVCALRDGEVQGGGIEIGVLAVATEMGGGCYVDHVTRIHIEGGSQQLLDEIASRQRQANCFMQDARTDLSACKSIGESAGIYFGGIQGELYSDPHFLKHNASAYTVETLAPAASLGAEATYQFHLAGLKRDF